MTRIEHLNFGWLHKPPLPPASCHCLLVLSGDEAILIDTGIGMHDIRDPQRRIGSDAIDAAGFKFLPDATAIRQLESRGIAASAVTDIVLTHCDSDHVGGLSDFPKARVHVASEEKDNLDAGNTRYTPHQFSHGPDWHTYSSNDSDMLGLPSRKIQTSVAADIRLVPLFGHTNGHCGVAMNHDGTWMLHVGDAYYLRDELTNENHPITELAAYRADNNELRIESLEKLRRLTRRTDVDLTYFGYHDITELPDSIPMLEDVA
jgi:glyoxylase-like metal-dependent hydrolase (beta-lactamase superfamily II)